MSWGNYLLMIFFQFESVSYKQPRLVYLYVIFCQVELPCLGIILCSIMQYSSQLKRLKLNIKKMTLFIVNYMLIKLFQNYPCIHTRPFNYFKIDKFSPFMLNIDIFTLKNKYFIFFSNKLLLICTDDHRSWVQTYRRLQQLKLYRWFRLRFRTKTNKGFGSSLLKLGTRITNSDSKTINSSSEPRKIN